jgi:hypothetical protein
MLKFLKNVTVFYSILNNFLPVYCLNRSQANTVLYRTLTVNCFPILASGMLVSGTKLI